MKVVFLGIYRGADESEGYVGSAGGSVQDVDRDCLIFKGIGGNSRKVSLRTARTVEHLLNTGCDTMSARLRLRTVFQLFDIIIGRRFIQTTML